MREGKVRVAQGPASQRRAVGWGGGVLWYADPAEPGLVWCGVVCAGMVVPGLAVGAGHAAATDAG